MMCIQVAVGHGGYHLNLTLMGTENENENPNPFFFLWDQKHERRRSYDNVFSGLFSVTMFEVGNIYRGI